MNQNTHLVAGMDVLTHHVDGVFAINQGGTTVFWNETLHLWTHRNAQDVLGHDVRDFIPALNADNIWEVFRLLFGRRLPFVLSSLIHPDLFGYTGPGGQERICRIAGRAIGDADACLALCFVKDLSYFERSVRELSDNYSRTSKQLEHYIDEDRNLALQRVNLEKTIDEKTSKLRLSVAQLEDINRKLEQADRHKTMFLSSMSHELRTPLNAILGFTDLLRGQFFGDLNEKQLGYVSQIDASSKHLLALISDLLDIAKIDAGTMELNLEEIPVAEFIYATEMMMKPQFTAKNLQVTVSLDSTITSIQADRRRWKQIMLNLLSNAVKYTDEEGLIDIRVERKEDAYILVSVRDNGVGMKTGDVEKVFLDFYQAESVRDQQLGGTGIGLALTKRMVKLHGGEIHAESEPGVGSRFWFTLPINHDVELKPPTNLQPDRPFSLSAKKHCILIVEDDQTNLEMLLDMVSIHGHEAHGAHNGKEALKHMEHIMEKKHWNSCIKSIRNWLLWICGCR